MARVALVTGGMGGLGESVCIKLAALGYKVVTTHSPGNTTAAKGRTVQLHEHDLLQRQHRQRAADEGFQDTYRQHRPMCGCAAGRS